MMELGKRLSPEDENSPPHSRIFVVCGRTVSESALTQAFSRFGTIQHVHMVRDKQTHEPKGFCFLKYDRASAAMLAVENMNGVVLDNESRPMKVVIAEQKGADPTSSALSSGDMPAHSRLYVVCPKDMGEETLQSLFGAYGPVEHVHVVRDKATQAHKGFAYVKYSKASVAARAMEEVAAAQANIPAERKLKVVVAQPRGSKPLTHASGLLSLGMGLAPGSPYSMPFQPASLPRPQQQQSYDNGMGFINLQDNSSRYVNNFSQPQLQQQQQLNQMSLGGNSESVELTRLFISMPSALPEHMLVDYFKMFGNVDYLKLLRGKNCGYVKYQTAQSAQLAVTHMNNCEIHGIRLRVQIADPPRNKAALTE
eukprot:gnl/Hemi2/20031_TR6642_c0_g1_i1.p1 gnl/Hemi2/20031_TR6642_c0_g1~~gnl/Hemi2/20031_TR6642_c0_g1_i1.p1  ORF type:complete len:367 (+),score=106.63 gnl/Hemi2/20031_TR6642_c0_g1_i1:1-1101(+)